jgi:hypothetical protein
MRDDEDTKADPPEQDESDEAPASAPTRAGSNVPNAGRDADEERTE